MKCEHIQKMIITDYLDNELDAKAKQEIELHLNTCKACREFAETARTTVKQPFEDQDYLQPPQAVWKAIDEHISREQYQGESLLDSIKHRLLEGLLTRRMVLATITTLFAVVIAVGVFDHTVGRKAKVEAYFSQQADAYSYLQNANGDFNGYKVNFGTALEEYFL